MFVRCLCLCEVFVRSLCEVFVRGVCVRCL